MIPFTLDPHEFGVEVPCPRCGSGGDTCVRITRTRQDRSWGGTDGMREVFETIPAKVTGWILPCSCVLPAPDWEWICVGSRIRWERKAMLPQQGVIIGDHGTQHNTFT